MDVLGSAPGAGWLVVGSGRNRRVSEALSTLGSARGSAVPILEDRCGNAANKSPYSTFQVLRSAAASC